MNIIVSIYYDDIQSEVLPIIMVNLQHKLMLFTISENAR